MSFLTPAFLWTLAALLPLAAIYFLKVRPRKKPVTAFFLWQRVFTEKKASALFKRLRDVLSLLLMALAFAAIALALAEPNFNDDERKDLLIVVDNSASMSAIEGNRSRLDRAKAKATALIKGLNGSQRAAVASFAQQTRILEHPTRHRKGLLEAVENLQPTQLPSRVNALRALQPGDEWMDTMRVILVTDGCLDSTELPARVEVLSIQDDASNIGIGRADLRYIPGGPARLGLFISPVASITATVETDLILTHVESNRIIKMLPVTLNPGENPAITLTMDDAPAGRWKAELAHQDALPLDNIAWFHVPPRAPVPVAVQADNPYFFQNAVGAFERSDQLLTLAPDLKSAQLLLGKGQIPNDISALVFHPLGEDLVKPVIPKVLIKDHPLLRYLDAEGINFIGARKLTPPAGSVVVVADEGGTPLIYLSRQGDHNICVVNLDPVAAQFYLSTWFPVLVHNTVAHLTRRADLPPPTLPTGTTIVPGLDTAQGPILETGFHLTGDWTLAASLVAPQESRTNQKAVVENAKPLASGESPSYWLLVLAIAVLVGESILYHRRKVG